MSVGGGSVAIATDPIKCYLLVFSRQESVPLLKLGWSALRGDFGCVNFLLVTVL